MTANLIFLLPVILLPIFSINYYTYSYVCNKPILLIKILRQEITKGITQDPNIMTCPPARIHNLLKQQLT